MKKKLDIRQNPQRLTGQQIARYKNFDGLLKMFRNQPKPHSNVRRLMYLGGAIAASLVGLFFIFQMTDQQGFEEKQQAFFDSKPFIDPPLDNVEPQFASFSVNPHEGGVYEYPSGSKLVVPAAAFVNQKGETLSGEVVLHYREMHDFVDFFISGIPMTYDSAGVVYNLESAGMIELFAEQNGQRIAMAPGKSINVELVSRVNVSPSLDVPPGYNIYKLDETKRNWAYREIDRMELLGEDISTVDLDKNSPAYPAQKTLADKMQAIQVTRDAALAKIENTLPKSKEPVKPMRANGSDYVFDLDFNDLKKPNATGETATTQSELADLYRQYEKMLWQLNPESNITPEWLQREFSNVSGLSIRKLDAQNYELTLEKDQQSITVIITPVLSGADYEQAMAGFNRDFETWMQKVAERESKLAASKAALQKQMDEEKRLAMLTYEEKIAELRKQGFDYAANHEIIKKRVVNRFTASEFGIWNCDRPLPPEVLQLAASFKDQSGKLYKNKAAYLVDKSRNTVYQFLADDGTQLRFNKNSENLLWLVTEDNKIAVFRPEQFKQIDANAMQHEFVLQAIDKEIKDEQDVRDILYL